MYVVFLSFLGVMANNSMAFACCDGSVIFVFSFLFGNRYLKTGYNAFFLGPFYGQSMVFELFASRN